MTLASVNSFLSTRRTDLIVDGLVNSCESTLTIMVAILPTPARFECIRIERSKESHESIHNATGDRCFFDRVFAAIITSDRGSSRPNKTRLARPASDGRGNDTRVATTRSE